eukprot:m.238778 g.238778  ORF g.238778 m.238778 type:complete len:676 (-) comp22022_c0_seq1:307-2334(-)
MALDPHRDAYMHVLAARLSHLIEVPFFDSLLGPDGGRHIACNIERDEVSLFPATALPEAPRKKDKGAKASKFANVRVPRDVPSWFDALCSAIEQNASVPGLFRISGAKKTVEKLQGLINSNSWVDFASDLRNHKYNVHALSSLLKSFLSALDDPLIPCYQHSPYLDILKIPSEEKRIEAVTILLLLCPPGHRRLLRRLVLCLKAVSSQAAANQMDLPNVAKCIATTILRPSRLATAAVSDADMQRIIENDINITIFLINNADSIFKVPTWLADDVSKMEQLMREGKTDAPTPKQQHFVAGFIDAAGRVHDGSNHVDSHEYEEIVRKNTEQALLQLRAQAEAAAASTTKEAKSTRKLAQKVLDAVPATPSQIPSTRKSALSLSRLFSRTPKTTHKLRTVLFADPIAEQSTPPVTQPAGSVSPMPTTARKVSKDKENAGHMAAVPPSPANCTLLNAPVPGPAGIIAQSTTVQFPAATRVLSPLNMNSSMSGRPRPTAKTLEAASSRHALMRSPSVVSRSTSITGPATKLSSQSFSLGARTYTVGGVPAAGPVTTATTPAAAPSRAAPAFPSPMTMLASSLNVSHSESVIHAYYNPGDTSDSNSTYPSEGPSSLSMSFGALCDSSLSSIRPGRIVRSHSTRTAAVAQMVALVEKKRQLRKEALPGYSETVQGTRFTFV